MRKLMMRMILKEKFPLATVRLVTSKVDNFTVSAAINDPKVINKVSSHGTVSKIVDCILT